MATSWKPIIRLESGWFSIKFCLKSSERNSSMMLLLLLGWGHWYLWICMLQWWTLPTVLVVGVESSNDCSHQVCVHVCTAKILAQVCFWIKYAYYTYVISVFCKRGSQSQCIETTQQVIWRNGHLLAIFVAVRSKLCWYN